MTKIQAKSKRSGALLRSGERISSIPSPIGYIRKYGGLPPTKKALGQNWLNNSETAKQIVDILNPMPKEQIVEVGPGCGALTDHLLSRQAQVIAVEIDQRLLHHLESYQKNYPTFRIHHADILQTDLATITDHKPFSVIGNLPYHITSSMLFKLFDHAREHPGTLRRAVLMVQLEVAKRIVAQPGESEYGILSVFIRFWGEPELALVVPKEQFTPSPKVNAGILRLDFSAAPRYPLPDWLTLKRLVKGAFAKRRKMLRNSLPGIICLSDWKALDFDWSRRPQTVSAEEFAALAEKLIPKNENQQDDNGIRRL